MLCGLCLGLLAACGQGTSPAPTFPPARTATAIAPVATAVVARVTPTPSEPPAASPTAPAVGEVPTGQADATSTPTVTAEGPCTNNASFVGDVTVPDGTQFLPGQLIDKRWKVRNSGTCDWNGDYRLVLVSGNGMGARTELALYPAKGGTEVEIAVVMAAPAEPGSYTGRWQARDPEGNLFGDRIFVIIEVIALPVTDTPTP